MATNFPSSLDSWTTKSDNVDSIMAAHVNDLQDAVDAIETKLGIDSSGTSSTIDYKLKNTSQLNPGHKHTMTNGATDLTPSITAVNTFFGLAGVWAYEDDSVAPTGWSIVASTGDKVLGTIGGSTYLTGGATAGDWTISGITQAGHSHTVNSHSHSYALIIHSHPINVNTTGKAVGPGTRTDGSGSEITSDGAGTVSGPTATTTSNPTPGTNSKTPTITHTPGWRPDACVGIIIAVT